jgi:hypothetical protein
MIPYFPDPVHTEREIKLQNLAKLEAFVPMFVRIKLNCVKLAISHYLSSRKRAIISI